jgi:hypothetical protein
MIETEGEFERWRDTITIYTQPPLVAHIKIRDKGNNCELKRPLLLICKFQFIVSLAKVPLYF